MRKVARTGGKSLGMKTMEEFVEEIAGSAALQDELGAIKD